MINASGHWKGFYVQTAGLAKRTLADALEEEKFPIEGWFEQQGSSFSGKMRDGRTERSYRLAESLAALGFLTRRKLTRFIQQYPDAMVHATLPPDSEVTGSVRGSNVKFIKNYIGEERYVFTFADRKLEDRRSGLVFYVGLMTSSGDRIEGYYRVTRNIFKREWRTPQPFCLIRQTQ